MRRCIARYAAITVLASAVMGSLCKKQQPPVVPNAPTGPGSGAPGVSYVFRVAATDPDGGQVCCRFDWGDGKVSPWSRYVTTGTEVSFTHKWDAEGSYAVKALAQDEQSSESGWSPNLDVAIAVSSQNQAPGNPGVPSGTTSGEVGVSYEYTATASDPEGDSIAIRFDWGDSQWSDWSAFVASGSSVTMSHSWGSANTYAVKAQAKDIKSAESGWSDALSVAITTGGGNNPPGTPTTPSGPSSGTVGTSYDFSSSATDPDGDSVAIRFNWGDGDTSGWSNLASSGSTVPLSHAWTSANTFGITAQARDSKGLVSTNQSIKYLTSGVGGV